MLAILLPALWIVFDVGICLRTGFMTAPFPTWEACAWGAVGVVLGVTALIAGWQDRETAHQSEIAHERSSADLRLQVASAKSFSEGAYTIMGRRLDSIEVQAQAAGNTEIRSEVSQLKAEINPSPTLSVEIKVMTILVAADPANWSDVIFDILIRNSGKPTAIADWSAFYRNYDGKSIYVPNFAFSREPDAKRGNNNLVLDERVIPEGGFRSGFVKLRLSNEDLRAITDKEIGKIAIHFSDVAGRRYVAEWPPAETREGRKDSAN